MERDTWIAPSSLRAAMEQRHGKRGPLYALRRAAWRHWLRELREWALECPLYDAAADVLYALQEDHPRLRGDNWESVYAIGSGDEDLAPLLGDDA